MKVAVIGGAGRMGQWLVRYFVSHGHRVTVSDVRLGEARAVAEAAGVELAGSNVEAVKNADLVVVSVPIGATPTVVREIAPHSRKGAVIAEISSLKSRTAEALAELARLDVKPLSLHPLFGPGARKLKGRKVAVVPVLNSKAETELAEELFPEAEIVVAAAEEHDRAMALTLSLPYFVNMAFASVIGGDDLMVLKKLEGTTFKLQLTLAESIMAEDPDLHASLQMDNKHAARYLDSFLSQAEAMRGWIAEKDEEKFAALCNRVRGMLSKDVDFTKAYEKMYDVLEVLL